GLSPSSSQGSRRSAARSQTAESHLRPRQTTGSLAAPAGQPITARRSRALPRGLLARRQPAADRHGRSLGHALALSAKTPAEAIAGVRGICRPDADSVQGTTAHGASRRQGAHAGLVHRRSRHHPGHGGWHHRPQPAGGAGAVGGACAAQGL
ncbi:Zn-ribbon-containing, possibly RNA-binding protein and truncated derivatives, partial [Pseudomonas sp. FG-3G]